MENNTKQNKDTKQEKSTKQTPPCDQRICYGKADFSKKAADTVTSFVGSWKFIILQAIFFGTWIILNALVLIEGWDPSPFIMLNLMLSFIAAFTAPIILMSQNITAEKDRKKVEADLAADRRAERAIIEIKKQLDRIENKKISRIEDTIGSKDQQN
jgi:uncharacterized membrane protein